MRPWSGVGLTAILLAALAAGVEAPTESKSATSEPWKPADQKIVVYTKEKPQRRHGWKTWS